MLNHWVVIVRPKQPYVNWAAELDDSGVVPDVGGDKTIYLIPSFETPSGSSAPRRSESPRTTSPRRSSAPGSHSRSHPKEAAPNRPPGSELRGYAPTWQPNRNQNTKEIRRTSVMKCLTSEIRPVQDKTPGYFFVIFCNCWPLTFRGIHQH